jgi:isopenicillin N synthase-like dioxygenase
LAVVVASLLPVSESSNYQPQAPKSLPGRTVEKIPVIDLASKDNHALADEIAEACSTYGFFQVVGHKVPKDLMERFQEQCQLYFDLEASVKSMWRRNATNARGFFDDELTQQRRDWKECLDVGVPGSRSWDIQDHDTLNGMCGQ